MPSLVYVSHNTQNCKKTSNTDSKQVYYRYKHKPPLKYAFFSILAASVKLQEEEKQGKSFNLNSRKDNYNKNFKFLCKKKKALGAVAWCNKGGRKGEHVN